MCLIAYGKKSAIMDLGLEKIWSSNPHGAGLIIPRQKPLVIKGIMKLDSLKKTLEHISDNTKLAVHFRFATHGAINEDNTHPFRVGPISWLMHNGMLSGLGKDGDKGYSDSKELATIMSYVRAKDREKLLDLLPGRYFYSFGPNVFMSGMSQYKGVWCSNTYWDSTAHVGYSGNWSKNAGAKWQGDGCYLNSDIADINKLAIELAESEYD